MFGLARVWTMKVKDKHLEAVVAWVLSKSPKAVHWSARRALEPEVSSFDWTSVSELSDPDVHDQGTALAPLASKVGKTNIVP